MSAIEPEPTVASETVFDGNLITVRRVTVRLPSGKTAARELVDHPEVIAVLPVLEDGRLVLVRQYRKAAERVLLEVPAGGIDDGETPEECVRREMKEETGYDVGSMELLSRFYTSPGYTDELMHLYRASDLKPGTATEQTDQIEVVLLSTEEAWQRVESGEIADAKSILAILYARIESST